MKRTFALAALLLLAPLFVPSAPAQEGCSIHTITGTWGFGGDGKSVIASAKPDPATFHFPGLILPAAFVGRFTVSPNGMFKGSYWASSWPTEIDFEGPVTVNPDCTGEWSFPSPGSTSPAVERFLIVDQGREIRAMGWATPIPTVAYTYVARRIPQRCTQGQVQGTYGMQCRGYVMVPGLPFPFPNPALVAATFLYRVTIDWSGEMAGRAVAKVGPGNRVLDLTGSFDVEADCSAAPTVTFSGLGTGHANAVLVENAKRGYLLPMFVEPAGGGPPVPEFGTFCEIVRMTDREWQP